MFRPLKFPWWRFQIVPRPRHKHFSSIDIFIIKPRNPLNHSSFEMTFLIEIAIWIIAFFILKKYWHLQRVQRHFIDFVIGINLVACIMYIYAIYLGDLSMPDGMGKIFLHGIVGLIVYTLTRDNTYKKQEDDWARFNDTHNSWRMAIILFDRMVNGPVVYDLKGRTY